jgi:PTH1 family peptidyl-tRNA hydrolase
LGTDALARLRVGIGTPPASWDAADYVLSRFAADELPVIALALERAADAAADWVREDTQFCMNRYNAEPAAPG